MPTNTFNAFKCRDNRSWSRCPHPERRHTSQVADGERTLKSYFNAPVNTELQTIAKKWKEIKKKADISTHESYDELIKFLDSVHEKAENELDARKNTWLQWGKTSN